MKEINITEKEKAILNEVLTKPLVVRERMRWILPYGVYVYLVCRKYRREQYRLFEEVIENNADVAKFLTKLNAEYDNKSLNIYVHETDEMRMLDDQALNNRIWSLVYNNFTRHFADLGLSHIISKPNMRITTFDAVNEEERLRLQMEAGINRKVEVELSVTFRDTLVDMLHEVKMCAYFTFTSVLGLLLIIYLLIV